MVLMNRNSTFKCILQMHTPYPHIWTVCCFDSDLLQIAAYNVTVTAYNSTTSHHKQPSFGSKSCRTPPRVCNSCASILICSSMRVTIQPYLQSQLTHNSITQTHMHMHPLRIAHCHTISAAQYTEQQHTYNHASLQCTLRTSH